METAKTLVECVERETPASLTLLMLVRYVALVLLAISVTIGSPTCINEEDW